MKTAVLISGQLRTFAQCYPTQRWQVYRHFPDPHFFIVVENNDQVNSVQALRRDYGDDHVFAKFIEDPKDLPVIPDYLGSWAPYANATTHANLMMQHWYQNEVWNWFSGHAHIGEYQQVIRMRGDNWFHQCDLVPMPSDEVLCPWWGRFGGINDRFAVMDIEAAPSYFTLYNAIPEILKAGCPFHPESLLFEHLKRSNVTVNPTLNAIFSTLRLPKQLTDDKGNKQWVQEMRFPEIQPHETAEYARSK